jgi:23S rRNA pseudouridine1911/1915/1917 synthase
VDILFENDEFIAVNKTEYIRVEAGPGGGDSLENKVREFLAARQASAQDQVAGQKTDDQIFLGLVHRIDQPVTGVVLFAKTPGALSRVNAAFSSRAVDKLYWAISASPPPMEEGLLEHFLIFNFQKNKAYLSPRPDKKAKKAALRYKLTGKSERYFFFEIRPLTGRPHQIRAQMAAAGCPIRGDLKYGASRSNPGGGIHLHARALSFPVLPGELITVTSPPPEDTLWALFPRGD